ncbi:hypothetical protein JCM10212_004071 [Sporobolomyces blumeae]
MFPSTANDGKPPVLILDGGMGTTLQSYPIAQALDSNLWSSELLRFKEGRETLEALHRAWIDSGADVVESCTYQSSLPLFLPRDGPFSAELLSSSLDVMTSAIPLLTSITSSSSTCRAALSLGPFGASLQPGQEYAGLYPPPFGPAPSPSSIASGQAAFESVPLPLDDFSSRSCATARDPEDYLAAWHLLRLRHFASNLVEFAKLKVLAFETVPNVYEARAIRRAMAAFRRELGAKETDEAAAAAAAQVPFYISFVFPLVNAGSDQDEGVRFPDDSIKDLALDAQSKLIIDATFGPLDESGRAVDLADGIGFNCTSPKYAHVVVDSLSRAYSNHVAAHSPPSGSRPFFVLYPDGGSVYSVETRTWSHPLGLTDSKWAEIVSGSIERLRAVVDGAGAPVWKGVLAGGCCKAGPGAIKELSRVVRERGWR